MDARRKALAAVLALVMVAGCSMPLKAAEPKPPEAPEPAGVRGKVLSVTLYRGQALVTRTVPVDKPAGQVELLVAELPEQTVPESLFAEAGEGLEVRAVRFRTRAVSEAPRQEVRALEEQMETLANKLARNKKLQALVTQRLAYLDKLEAFTVPTAKLEMAKGVLNVDTIKQISQFSFDERQKATEESLKLEDEARQFAKQQALLQRKLRELATGRSRTVREAIVFLEKRGAARGEIKLSYLVGGCGWSPAYNFRSNADRTKVAAEYNAIIQQRSGEDWDAVALTLSTASPALSAEAPGLAPFRVALAAPGKGKPRQVAFFKQFRDGQKRLRAAQVDQRKAQVLRDNRDANWLMNTAANDYQNVELNVDKDAFQILRNEASGGGQGPSVSYKIANPVSLASRTDQQMLRILDTQLATAFYHVASPILTSYVYREAELENTGEDVLLAGPVSVYLDGRFVGRGEMPTVAEGETFVMGFGADPQLRVRRERTDRKERVQGGNREIDVTYRITLENYKKQAVQVRVFDRRPVADRETDVRVTMGDIVDAKLSDDPLYLRLEEPKGILRWDVDVAASAAGEKAKTFTYSYKLEFDRNLALVNPTGAQATGMQQEFEELQQMRYNK